MTTKLLWLWKLAITRFALYSLVTCIVTFKTATDSVGWTTMNAEQHLDVLLDIAEAWCTVAIAFLDKAEKSLESGTGTPPEPDSIQSKTPPPIAA